MITQTFSWKKTVDSMYCMKNMGNLIKLLKENEIDNKNKNIRYELLY